MSMYTAPLTITRPALPTVKADHDEFAPGVVATIVWDDGTESIGWVIPAGMTVDPVAELEAIAALSRIGAVEIITRWEDHNGIGEWRESIA